MHNGNRIDQVNGASQLKNVRQMQLEHMGTASSSGGFGSILKEELQKKNGVQFSKHAAERVEQRGIELTDNLLQDLNKAVEKAKDKGAKDVVVISTRGAFIVNIPNNKVITSMSTAEMKENIFTNIDSAILL